MPFDLGHQQVAMENWDELTVTEQVLVRRVVTGTSLRGSAQHITAVLRWAGAPEVGGATHRPRKSWSACRS
ncbi:hypothetical protein [Kitasatospora sp. NPDC056531]|uniref:hypothetical protein n=1 Tax=Kitasatospora sp. NPDC056531 TaxID=3345856 RepID=UPI00369BE897